MPWVDAPVGDRIGMTLCLGKEDHYGISGEWKRGLELDMEAVDEWGVSALVALVDSAVRFLIPLTCDG